jgi:hypothetical protein
MYYLKPAFVLVVCLLIVTISFSQQKDSIKPVTTFSGSVGITNNGISIIPSFALNKPAVIVNLSWLKNKFSIDPDIRFSSDFKKGGILLWFRYKLVEKNKFSFRVGAHPALNFQVKQVTENGITSDFTQMRRFLAWELAPVYHITPNWSAGIYYLQGNGMQKDGPQVTHFVTLNTSISNIPVGGNFRLQLLPAVYYLYLDGYDGRYFTATGVLTNEKWPFQFMSTINKTFSANLPGNKDFMWNVTLNWHFSKQFIRVK